MTNLIPDTPSFYTEVRTVYGWSVEYVWTSEEASKRAFSGRIEIWLPEGRIEVNAQLTTLSSETALVWAEMLMYASSRGTSTSTGGDE